MSWRILNALFNAPKEFAQEGEEIIINQNIYISGWAMIIALIFMHCFLLISLWSWMSMPRWIRHGDERQEWDSSWGKPREDASKISLGPGSQRMFLLFATEPDSCLLPPESQVKCVHMNTLFKICVQQREHRTFVLNTGCIVIILPCVFVI